MKNCRIKDSRNEQRNEQQNECRNEQQKKQRNEQHRSESCRTKKYRHKLNMLEPGSRMLKGIALLLLLTGIFYYCGCRIGYYIAGVLASLLTLLLLILLGIEQHQDRVLNEQALEERKRNKDL